MLSRYVSLYAVYLKLFFRRLLLYRADFMILVVATAIRESMTVLFINVIFGRMQQLQGWSFNDVLLIYGIITISRFLFTIFLDVPWGVQAYIQSGRLDTLLVRPVAPLFQLIGERGFNFQAIGSVIVGIAIVAIALNREDLHGHIWWVPYIVLIEISGALLFFGLILVFACTAFYFTSVRSILYPLYWFADFAQYPIVIYGAPVRFVLTWVIPYGMVGFYPAAFLLRGNEYRVYGLLAPGFGILFLTAGLLVWHFSLRYYQSTGT